MKALLTFLICFLFTFSSIAQGIDRAEITWKGTKGVFFSEAIATELLIDLEEYKAQDRRIELLDTKLELKEEKLLLLEQSITLADGIADKYKINYELEHKLRMDDQKHYEQIINQKTAWYRTPIFWGVVGLVAGGLLSVGLTFGLNEARSN